MSYPKYFVSYTVMDQEAGANPFHHAFLTFSVQDHQDAPQRVENAYGFYSQPSESNWLWQAIGVTFKLQNSHGILKQEKFREIDAPGYSAKPIETTEKNYTDIIAKLQNQITEEQTTIDNAISDSVKLAIQEYLKTHDESITAAEMNAAIQAAIIEYKAKHGEKIELETQPKAIQAAMKAFYKNNDGYLQPEGIYKREQKTAKQENRAPRLQRFEFRFGYDFTKGMHTTHSYTCKTQALDTLEEFNLLARAKPRSQSISDLQTYEQEKIKLLNSKPRSKSENDINQPRCEIDSNDFGFAFPRTTDEPLEPLFLFSTGKLKEHKSKSNNYAYFNRDWDTGELFHALQPNLQHPLLPEIHQELLELKRLDKKLRKASNVEELDRIHQAQPKLEALFRRFTRIDTHTPKDEIEKLCTDSQNFRQFNNPEPENVSARFVFLSLATLLSGTLALAGLTLVLAVSCMSFGLPLIATAAGSGIIGFASGIGLFFCSPKPEKMPASPTPTQKCEAVKQPMSSIIDDEIINNEALTF